MEVAISRQPEKILPYLFSLNTQCNTEVKEWVEVSNDAMVAARNGREKSNIKLEHRRLRHNSVGTLEHTEKNGAVTSSDIAKFADNVGIICDACINGMTTNASY